jgi:hypothetical protein
LVNNPETNACSCQSGTIAKELFYTTSTEQLGGGVMVAAQQWLKIEYYINVDKMIVLLYLFLS